MWANRRKTVTMHRKLAPQGYLDQAGKSGKEAQQTQMHSRED